VVCPNSLLLNWYNEILAFSDLKSTILHSPIREERISIIKNSNTPIEIINYDALHRYFNLLTEKHYDMLIFDESSRYIKNMSSSRTQASILLADTVKYKLILTATPIANKPLDLWSQFRVLDGGSSFGTNYYSYRGRYFEKAGVSWKLKLSSSPILSRQIYKQCIMRKKRDCLSSLPDIVNQRIQIPQGDLGSTYNKIKKRVIAELKEDGKLSKIKMTNIFTKLLRLQQATSGFVNDSEHNTIELKHQPKLKALVEQVSTIVDSNESVVIWCRFKHSMKMIERELKKEGIESVSLSGSDNTTEKYAKWKGFQKDKNLKVFIGQVEAGGFGIELFKHDEDPEKNQHMIFYENTWSLDTRIQAMGRIDRMGQKAKSVVYTDLVIENSIDERILNAISNNKEIADLIMENGYTSML